MAEYSSNQICSGMSFNLAFSYSLGSFMRTFGPKYGAEPVHLYLGYFNGKQVAIFVNNPPEKRNRKKAMPIRVL